LSVCLDEPFFLFRADHDVSQHKNDSQSMKGFSIMGACLYPRTEYLRSILLYVIQNIPWRRDIVSESTIKVTKLHNIRCGAGDIFPNDNRFDYITAQTNSALSLYELMGYKPNSLWRGP